MRRATLVLGLVTLLIMALGASALAANVLPGSKGPYDLRALVSGSPSKVTLMWSTDVANGHPPYSGNTVTYTVYKHEKGDGRSFNPIQGAQCVVQLSPKQVVSGPCAIDPNYGYVTYTDTNVQDYYEYSYLVTDDPTADPNVDPWGGDPNDRENSLVAYVVVRAFPPSQTRHGNYTEYTNACTACHGIHSSKFKKLLKGPTVTDLCGTCHDGTGSKYDEVRGRVRTGAAWSSSAFAAAGPFGDRLKNGSGVQTTSAHNVVRAADPSLSVDGDHNIFADSARIWQAPGSGWATHDLNGGSSLQNTTPAYEFKYVSYDWSSYLACSSCHEPHDRGKNYRILRPVINDRTNIAVRGVSEVDPTVTDGSPDRGNWARRAMYTKFLAGGNSVMTYYDPQWEDPRGLEELLGSYDKNNPTDVANAISACNTHGKQGGSIIASQGYTDPSSPTGVRCELQKSLGGVTSFCTACHRTFMWPYAGSAKTSYSYSGGTIYGYDQSTISNSGSAAMGLSSGASLAASFGEHKHAIALPAMEALEEGRLIDGVLNVKGDICILDDALNNECNGQKPIQSRVQDPIVPLEGNQTDAGPDGVDTKQTYQDAGKVMCLTCHVPHGSGSERIEVAYKNDGLNDTTNASRDPITGYLWNRATNSSGPSFGSSEVQHPTSPGGLTPRWETQPAYLPQDTAWYTQYGLSSVLARFNPMAQACYRCHSTTPGGTY